MPTLTCDPVGAAGNGVVVVTYHQFGDHSSPLRNVTRADALAAQLDYFAANYNVISLGHLLAGEIPDNALLVTIDDAYKSVADIFAPALRARRLPAVFFANPRPILEPFVPWHDALAMAHAKLGLRKVAGAAIPGEAAASFDDLTDRLMRMSPSELAGAKERVLSQLGCTEAELHRASNLFLSADDMHRLADSEIEIANHTMSHVRCGALSPAELHSEIVDAKGMLEGMTGKAVRAFAFPWGHERDATPAALSAIRSSGHEAIFLMHARHNARRPAPDIWYRALITNETGLRLRANLNVLPVLRSWRALAGGFGPRGQA